jgi:hypothetical protein
MESTNFGCVFPRDEKRCVYAKVSGKFKMPLFLKDNHVNKAR